MGGTGWYFSDNDFDSKILVKQSCGTCAEVGFAIGRSLPQLSHFHLEKWKQVDVLPSKNQALCKLNHC